MTEQIGNRIVFAAHIPIQERPSALEQIRQTVEKGNLSEFGITGESPRNRLLTNEEKNLLDLVFEKASRKLTEIGISNSDSLLPKVEQIIVSGYTNPYSEIVGGYVPEFGQNIILQPPNGMPLTRPEVIPVLFHEIAHFVTLQVIGYSSNSHLKYSEIAWGFDKVKNTYIYGESTADIFSLFCMDNDFEIPTSYSSRVPFVISLLTGFAQRKDISPIDAFKRLFKAKVNRDFSFQKELVDVFGFECIRRINNIHPMSDMRDKLRLAAVYGGFYPDYSRLQETMDSNKGITFPGMTGVIKKIHGWE